jgi:eukaryotic-like serine/threonine-protein kinase
MGDPRTADPCALTDTASLNRFGRTVRETAYVNFDRCDVIMALSGGTRVQIKVQLDKPTSPEKTMEKKGPLHVIRHPDNGELCVRTLVLADQNRVSITAKLLPEREPGPADLCALADAAADYAVTVLSKGAIPRRAAPADTASLVRMDACALMDPHALTRALGADVSSPEAGFGDWECRWNSNTSKLSVRLNFDRNETLTSPDDGRLMTLNGRNTFVRPQPEEPDCVAQVVNRKDFDGNGNPVDELVTIAVTGPQTPDQLCGPAAELAAAAAAKLPPPR